MHPSDGLREGPRPRVMDMREKDRELREKDRHIRKLEAEKEERNGRIAQLEAQLSRQADEANAKRRRAAQDQAICRPR